MADLTIESLEIVIERKTSQASEQTDKLIESLRKFQDALKGFSPRVKKFTTSMTEMATAINSIDVGRLTAIAEAMERIKNAKLSKITKSAAKAAETAGIATPLGLDKQESGGEEKGVPKLGGWRAWAEMVRSSAEKNKKAFEGYYASVKKLSAPMTKIFKSLARIAMYRAVRTFISSITKAIKEGVQNLYAFDKAFGGTFSKSLDEAATSAQYLKNSLASAVAPALEALTPIIVQMADALAEFGNGIAVLTAQARGLDKITVAKRDMKEFADSAQKAKSAIMGFDELNNLSTSGDTSNMFEQVTIDDSVIADYKAKVAEIGNILAVGMMAMGALVTLLGHPALGIGMMITGGAAALAVSIGMGDSLTTEMADKLAEIMGIVGFALFAIGAVLAFTGAALPLGIGMMVAGAASLSGVVALNFTNGLSDELKDKLNLILGIVAGAGVALGAILLFTPYFGVGLALLAVGLAAGATAIALNWDNIVNWVKEAFGKIKNEVEKVWDDTVKMHTERWNIIKSFFVDTVGGFFKNTIPNFFTEAFNNIKTKFDSFWKKTKSFFTETIPNFFKNVGINIANSIIDGLNRLGNFTIPGFWLGSWKIWDDTTVSLFNIPKIPTYATGGFPEDGMFFANSNEMVGQFTNGRTAVANNEQIVEGISDGVYNAVVAALSESGGNGKPMNLNVYLDGKQIRAAVNQANYEAGARIATGGIVF